MIAAQKGGPLGWLWSAYIDRRLVGSFRGVWVRGPLPTGSDGLVLYLNHTNFWDGFLVHALARARGWDAYCAMEEQNLVRYPFLRRLGAFSIRPGDPASALESLRYAQGLLRRPRAAVALFPEGVLRGGATDVAPLKRGVEVLARRAKARCVPIALRYAFFEHERPDVLLEVGEAHEPLPLPELQARLGALVTRVQAVRSLDGFQPLVRGRPGVAERWSRPPPALAAGAGAGPR